MQELRSCLLGFGGRNLVYPLTPDIDMPMLMSRGEWMTGEIVYKRMAMSQCHSNVAKLWLAKARKLSAIGTGYALTEDGLWRQHSWGCCPDGIIETTTPRLLYWGVSYRGANADAFAKRALGTPTYWAVRLSRWRPFR